MSWMAGDVTATMVGKATEPRSSRAATAERLDERTTLVECIDQIPALRYDFGISKVGNAKPDGYQ
jgi:hypothetical protein